MSAPGEGQAGAEASRPRLPRAPWTRLKVRPALIAGRGNRVEGRGWRAALLRLSTLFVGASSDNVVTLGRNLRTLGLVIQITGSHNRVEIGDDVTLTGKISIRGFRRTIRIGARSDIKQVRIVAGDADVTIGRDCLVAAGVRMRTSDMHVITGRDTGQAINPPDAITVGDGVWIAGEAALLKGARVPDGCVVGFRSVVTKGFDEPDCILVGAPARIIRRRIAWSR